MPASTPVTHRPAGDPAVAGDTTGSAAPSGAADAPTGRVGRVADRIASTRALAEKLNCCVLLKGRVTVIATTDECLLVDAGCSWAATP